MTSVPTRPAAFPSETRVRADRTDVTATADDEEAGWIEAARRDPTAFGPLYRRHAPAIERYLRRRLGDSHVAEDALAETFVEALRGIGRYEARGLPLRAWLYRIATTRVHRARRRAALAALEPLPAESLPDVEHDDDSGPDLERVRRALLVLPERYQSALSLHYMEGLGVREVARVLGCREGTVKSRLARGRAALKSALERAEGVTP